MTTTKKKTAADILAVALQHAFTSPNVPDSNGEDANVVDALDKIGRGLHRIADALAGLDRTAETMFRVVDDKFLPLLDRIERSE